MLTPGMLKAGLAVADARRCGRTRAAGLLLAATLFAGCSASSASGADAAASSRPVLTVSPADQAKPADCKGAWTVAASGRVADQSGAPVVGSTVGFCTYASGRATCLAPGTTGAGGWFTYQIPAAFRCIERLTIRTSAKPDAHYAESYCRPALTPTAGALALQVDQVLHKLEAPSRLPKLGDPAALRAIAFASGVEISLIPNDLAEGELYESLGAVVLDPKAVHCFVPPGAMLDGLVAFGPSMNANTLGGASGVDFKLPNAARLPEGARVDLYVLGGVGTYLAVADKTRAIEEGEFVQYGTGSVVSDRIVPAADSKLPALTVVGYRRRG
jgi:hypothetical protein